MEQFFIDVFGVQNQISTAQEAARAVLIFTYGLALLRLSGPRMFERWSALDMIISIMIGSALARAMSGGAPLIGTMVAAAVMALLHVGLAHWVARNEKVARFFEGEAVTLIDHRALVEASGGITLDTLADVAATGVDLISSGALTHSAPSLDISLDFEIASS